MEELVPHEDKPEAEQVAQRGCAGSIAEGFRVLSFSSHEQHGLTSELILL